MLGIGEAKLEEIGLHIIDCSSPVYGSYRLPGWVRMLSTRWSTYSCLFGYCRASVLTLATSPLSQKSRLDTTLTTPYGAVDDDWQRLPLLRWRFAIVSIANYACRHAPCAGLHVILRRRIVMQDNRDCNGKWSWLVTTPHCSSLSCHLAYISGYFLHSYNNDPYHDPHICTLYTKRIDHSTIMTVEVFRAETM